MVFRVQRLIASNAIKSEVIVNTRQHAGRRMLQLETAAGAAIEVSAAAVCFRVSFSQAHAVHTRGSRACFTADLVVLSLCVCYRSFLSAR